MKVAAVQMQVVDGDPSANLQRAKERIASHPGADLYALPELWTTGYAHDRWPAAAREDTPRIGAELQDLARSLRGAIAGSMISFDEAGRLVNRLWVFLPDGSAVHYDKGHLFQPMDEHRHLAAGTRRTRLSIGGVETALSICFDLRFPEMYRRDAAEGAELFLVVAEWPHPRSAALRLLAQARALENQAYLALSNRVGPDASGTVFCGGSMIVGPDGTVMAEAGEAEGVAAAEVDAARVRETRRAFPVLELRREALDF